MKGASGSTAAPQPQELPKPCPGSHSVAADWRKHLPTLAGSAVTLRPLRIADAQSLFTMLSGDEVTRFISPPPPSIDSFERFIETAHREHAAGTCFCFAVVPHGMDVPIGLFQVRQLDPGFETAEWGFAIGSDFWGTGMFTEGAHLILEFVFSVIGVHRLEARASVRNGRGNGALRKLGALQEGVLRRAFIRGGLYHDQALWTILGDEWMANGPRIAAKIH